MAETLKRVSTCECGRVVCEAIGEPIVSAVCYCVDCQAAAANILTNYPKASVCEPDGGTAYSTFRDNQWICVQGGDLLVGVKLHEKSPTTRFIAKCCHSAIYLKYSRGFWVSTYRTQFKDPLPSLEWRNKIIARQSELPFPDDIPRFKGFPMRLFGRLMKAKIGQILRKRS